VRGRRGARPRRRARAAGGGATRPIAPRRRRERRPDARTRRSGISSAEASSAPICALAISASAWKLAPSP
jgi:hypothetical protein